MLQPEDLDRASRAGAEQEGEAAPGPGRGDQGSQEGSGRHLQLEQNSGRLYFGGLLKLL